MVPLVLQPARSLLKESVGTDGTNTVMQTATSALNNFMSAFGSVAAQNLTGQNQATVARQPAPVASGGFMDWIKANTALAIGGAVALVVVLALVFRRR